jgi:RNA polymerase sigma-70 factor (ECF subfamily)
MDTPTKVPDKQLLEAARGGDIPSLEALLERHQAQVYRFGMKMCRDPEDAKDVLQDTLLAMARNVRDFRGASSISTWLYTIARNFCIKKRRRSTFAPEEERSLDTDVAPEAARLADPAMSPDEILAGREVEQALDQAIGALEPMYREVLLLRDVEGLTAPEVAEVLGVSVQAVKSRLHRARLSVRARVAPLLGIASEPAAAAPGTCPDVLTLFSQHLESEISADACAEMERHIEVCGHCRGACGSLKRTLALCRAAPSAHVPAAVQDSVRVALRNFLAEPSTNATPRAR